MDVGGGRELAALFHTFGGDRRKASPHPPTSIARSLKRLVRIEIDRVASGGSRFLGRVVAAINPCPV
jgi:hypothetical protein